MDLCHRFHKLPSEIKAEGSELLRYMEIVRRGTPVREEVEEDYG
jgi:hypothetical protein